MFAAYTMDKFSYGDLRINKLVKEFYLKVFEHNSVCLRAIAGCRKTEVAFHRLIKNSKFTAEKMIEQTVCHSKENSKNIEHILCIQDTSEVHFDTESKRVRKGLGPLGNSFCKGLFVHPGLLIDAQTQTVLGLSDVQYWIRKERPIGYKRTQEYKKFPIEEKESIRCLTLAKNTKSMLSQVKHLTIIADRESDIYEEWSQIPEENVDLITRACSNRKLKNKEKLYQYLAQRELQFCYKLNLSEITGKRKKKQRI